MLRIDKTASFVNSAYESKVSSSKVPQEWFPKSGTQNNGSDADLKLLNEKSKIGDVIPTKASLKANGFEKSEFMDMSGGIYYENKNGDSIRIKVGNGFGDDLPIGFTCVSFTSANQKTKQEVVFDSSGEPVKGTLSIEDNKGNIELFKYEYDINGNKSVSRYMTCA
jgi:hypothetical protein